MKRAGHIVSTFLFVLGIFMIVLGILVTVLIHNQNKTCTQTTSATIIDIDTKTVESSQGIQQMLEVIQYTVDGKTYKNEIIEAVSTDKVGDVINIRYNPENPNEFIESNPFHERLFSIIPFTIGTILIILGYLSRRRAHYRTNPIG